jgi:hypothetical protein
MRIFGRKFDDKKVKKNVYTAVLVALIIWFVYRFVMVAIESRMTVFNPVRDAGQNGTPIETVTVKKQDGAVNMPIAIKNNRAYVSGRVRAKLRAGQKIAGGGTIANVSNSIDFDSGMYVVQTRGANDGVQNVQIPCSGYFVPVYAVRGESVMVADGTHARARGVVVAAQDSDMACISSGVQDDDIVILSKVSNNQKVNIQK